MSKEADKRLVRSVFFLICAMIFLITSVQLTKRVVEKIDYVLHPLEYGDFVEEYAAQNKLPPALVFAVINCESSFQPDAVSPIGARGLMQITEETFDWIQYRMGGDEAKLYTYDDMFDPETNIRYGTFLLRLLLDEFDTTSNALCAYHAGWGSVKSWLADPEFSSDGKNVTNIPFADTRTYVERVLKNEIKYSELYEL